MMSVKLLVPSLMFCIYHFLLGQVDASWHFYLLIFSLLPALEGYFFYRALVTVFDTHRLSSILFYIVGYGVPLLQTIITLIVSQIGGDTLYLWRNVAGDVVACWLDLEAMSAIVVPAGNFFI